MLRSKRDGNHHAIVRVFEHELASVIDLSGVGGGCPDLLIGVGGIDQLCEVKLPEGKFGGTAHSKLNHRQKALHRKWSGRPPVVVRTEEEARALVRALEAEAGAAGNFLRRIAD